MVQQARPFHSPTQPGQPEDSPPNAVTQPESRLVFLDRLEVTEGVCRQATLRSASDLILGDEIRFPPLDQQPACSIATKGADATVRMSMQVQVGQTAFAARLSHRMTLMSDLGQVVLADLFGDTSGRAFFGLAGRTDPQRSYTLIAASATLPSAPLGATGACIGQ